MKNPTRTITLTLPLQVFRGLTWLAVSGEYDDFEANQMEEYGDGYPLGWKLDWEACSDWMRAHLEGLHVQLDPAYEVYRICDGTRWGIFQASADAEDGDLWTLTAARAHCLEEAGVPALEYVDTVYSGDPEAENGSEERDLVEALEEKITHLKLRVAILEARERGAR